MFVLFQGTAFVVICYSSNDKRTHLVSLIVILPSLSLHPPAAGPLPHVNASQIGIPLCQT